MGKETYDTGNSKGCFEYGGHTRRDPVPVCRAVGKVAVGEDGGTERWSENVRAEGRTVCVQYNVVDGPGDGKAATAVNKEDESA